MNYIMLISVVVTMFLYNFIKKTLETEHDENHNVVKKASTKDEIYGFLLTTGYSILVIIFG